MKIDQYTILSRFTPAVLTALPIAVLYLYLLRPIIGELVGLYSGWIYLGDFSAAFLFTYVVAQLARAIGKWLEDKHFVKESDFPTTRFLLHSDRYYSSAYKQRLHSHIGRVLSITLLTPEEEKNNFDEAVKTVRDCVGLMRGRVKHGRLLIQRNMEYGFMRNLLGGSVFGVGCSVFNVIIFLWISQNSIALGLSLALLGIYGVLVLLTRYLLNNFGERYAHTLFSEFLEVSV